MHKFGATSKKRLSELHKDLQEVLIEAIDISPVDFSITTGYRSTEEQQRLFAQGRSTPGDIVTNVDGIVKKSKHNHRPSMAVDIAAYVNGKVSWDEKHLLFLGGIIMAVAGKLYQEGRIEHKVRWGGNWDSDGEIYYDQRLIDLPHFEI